MTKNKKQKLLFLDIETAPNIAYLWRLRADYVSVDQLVSSSYVLCVSAMWLNSRKPMYTSIKKHGKKKMLSIVYNWLKQADVVVHYNGKKFDIPNLNREFVEEGMAPPKPTYKQVDMYHVVRHQFKFTSNKLDYVCQKLGLGEKVRHKGMSLWEECMAGNKKAWATMEKYNKRDVVLLKRLFRRILPWVMNHTPSARVLNGKVA